MRKDALTITVATVVLGIFGAFLRWLQNINIFEESGLAVPGAGISTVFVIYSLAAFAVMVLIVLVWLKRYDRATGAAEALHTFTVAPAILTWVFCAAFVIAALTLMFAADNARYPMLQRYLGAAGIICGFCFPFIPGRRGKTEVGSMSRAAAVAATLFYCYWLIFTYKLDAENPVLWACGPEVLAVVSSVLAFYYITAYFYKRAKPNTTLIIVQVSSYLNLCALSDERRLSLNVMFAVSAAMMLLFEFILIANMKENSCAE